MHLVWKARPQHELQISWHKLNLRSSWHILSDIIRVLFCRFSARRHFEQMPVCVWPPQSHTQFVVEKYCDIVLFFDAPCSAMGGFDCSNDLSVPTFVLGMVAWKDRRYCDFRGRSANLIGNRYDISKNILIYLFPFNSNYDFVHFNRKTYHWPASAPISKRHRFNGGIIAFVM